MKKLNKQILSALLALLMFLNSCPVSAFAADLDETVPETTQTIEATQPEVTDPPVTEPPVTAPPTTEPPTTEPPTTEPPASDPAATDPVGCQTCGKADCTVEHTNWCAICEADECGKDHSKWCDICKKDECGLTHVFCEICKKHDCGVAHVYCETCEAYDCGVEHVYCKVCKVNDCGKTHVFCKTCDQYDCGKKHVFCDICNMYDCIVDGHGEPAAAQSAASTEPTAPSEPAATVPAATEPTATEPVVTEPVDNCPYCDDTTAEDGAVVHASNCNTNFPYNGAEDVGKYATLTSDAKAYGLAVSGNPKADPDGMQFYAEDFEGDVVLHITGWYWDISTSALWYRVGFYSGSVIDEAKADWPAPAWILNSYTNPDNSYGVSLSLFEGCSVCDLPDCEMTHVLCKTCNAYDCTEIHVDVLTGTPKDLILAAANTDPLMGKLVKFKSAYPYVWSDPANVNSQTPVTAANFPAQMRVVDTHSFSESTTLYKLESADGSAWPAEHADYVWAEAKYLEIIEENTCSCCETCTGDEECQCGCGACAFCEPAVPELKDETTGVTVLAESFPAGVSLSVSETDVTAQLDQFGVSAEKQVFGLDISLLDADNAVTQPDGTVLVKIPVDVAVGTKIGILHTHGDKTTYMGMTEVLTDGTVEFFTDGFSTFAGFTVDFHYNNIDYSIDGLTSIKLSELFEILEIDREASNAISVVFSDPELVEVTELKEEGDWLLTSLEAFDTNELLTVTFYDGEIIVIDVTDATTYTIYNANNIYGKYILSAQGGIYKIGWNIYLPSNISSISAMRQNRSRLDDPEANNFWGTTVQSSWTSSVYWFYAEPEGDKGKISDGSDGKHSILHTNLSMTNRRWFDIYAVPLTNYSNGNYCTVSLYESILSRSAEPYTVIVKANGTEVGRWTGLMPTRETITANSFNVTPYGIWRLDSKSLSGTTLTVNLYSVHNITFVDEDGTVLKGPTSYRYGTTASSIAKPTDPQKAADTQYTYTFAGWTPAIATVTSDATYTATYSKTLREYTIKFLNEDSTQLQSGKVAYGNTPVYSGATPTKAADAQYTYTFANWTPTIAKVTGDATYTATYGKTVNKYTIKYNAGEGTGSMEDQEVAYGDSVDIQPNGFTAPAGYQFDGWTTRTDNVDDGNGWTDWKGKWEYGNGERGISNRTLNLYARWVPCIYYVSLDTASGTGGTVGYYYMFNTTVKHGETDVNDGGLIYYYTDAACSNPMITGSGGDRYYSIVPPTRQGYTFGGYFTGTNGTGKQYVDSTGICINNIYENEAQDTTLYAYWIASDDTPYTVYHYQQDLNDGTKYTLVKTEDSEGTTGENTKAAAKNYAGFTAQPFDQITIAGDGSTEVNIYYNRNSYSVTVNKGTGISSVTGGGSYKYGASVTINATLSAGYHWKNWTGYSTQTAQSYTFTMPASNVTYIANAEPNTDTPYTVNHYQQNLDDGTKYTLVETENCKGTTDQSTEAAAKTYDGFTAQTFSQKTVTADGKAVVDIFYDRNSYTVTFMDEDKVTVLLEAKTYLYDTASENVEKPDAPTKPADAQYTYSFNGWDKDIADVTDNVIYYATYGKTINKYTIKFVHENGNVLQSGEVEYGQKPVYSGAEPTKAETAQYSYTFKGWDKEIVAVTGEATYTAKFDSSARKYKVEVYLNPDHVTYTGLDDFTTVDGHLEKELEYGTTVEPVFTVKEGYCIQEILVDNVVQQDIQNGKVSFEVLGATLVEVKTAPIEYDLTWKYGNGDEDKVEKVAYGTAITKPSDPVKTGYVFDGWDKEIPKTMPAEDLTFTAKWKIKQIPVTFKHYYVENGQEYVIEKKPSTTHYIEYGKVIAVADFAEYAEEFDAYAYVGPKVKEDYKVTENENQVIILHYQEKTATFTYVSVTVGTDGNGNPIYGGTVSPESETVRILNGNATEATAKAMDGYSFAGWYATADCSGEPMKNTEKFVPAKNAQGYYESATYYAKFVKTVYTVTFKTDANTVHSTADYTMGDTVTLAKPEKTGYICVGWYWDADNDGEIDENEDNTLYNDQTPFTMPSENVTLIAQWERNVFTITFVDDDGDKFKDMDEMNVEYGETVTIPAAPAKTNARFQGWCYDADGDDTVDHVYKAGDQFEMPENDVTLTARWIYAEELTITAYGTTGDTFFFKVTGATENVNLTVSVPANSSVTINGLFHDTYTVEELHDWSWTYVAGGKQDATLSADDGDTENEVTFKMSNSGSCWLHD